MPVYEFLCDKCKTVFTFHSNTVDTTTIPSCPKCRNTAMKKQCSIFSTNRKIENYDEGKIVNGFEKLIENIEEEKAENIAGRLMDFAVNSGVEFQSEIRSDLSNYLESDRDESLKEKFDKKICLDSCSFSKGDVFIRKEEIYLFDEKLYDLHQK